MTQQISKNISSIIGALLGLGMVIVLFIIGLVFFSYLLIIGAIVGVALFVIAYIKSRRLMKKHQQPSDNQSPHRVGKGRIIDQEE